MTEWIIIIAICIIIPVVFAGIKISWNVAKGGTDLMELLGNAGRAGTVRQQSNNEINANKKKKFDAKNKKWGNDGKRK